MRDYFSQRPTSARYARMLLNGGELDGIRIFKPETVQLMTSVQTPPNVNGRRGLGWDIDTGYSGPRGEFFRSARTVTPAGPGHPSGLIRSPSHS